MPNAIPDLSSPDTLASEFEKNGYFVVHRVLTPAECDELKAEALRLLERDRKSVLVGVAAMSPRYRQLSEDARILDRIAPLLPDGITFQSDKFVYKNGSQRFATPWHTDNQYWAGKRAKLSVWIPLDDVSADNGTLTVVPGSHRRTGEQVKSDGQETNGEFRNRVAGDAIGREDVVACEVPRGSIVVFSDALLHGSTMNESGTDRYAIIATYHETRIPETEPLGPATKVLTRRG